MSDLLCGHSVEQAVLSCRICYETLQRERDEALRELATIKAQADDATEYVLAQINRRLRTVIDDIIARPDYTNPEGMVRRLRDALKGEGE